MFLRIEDVLSPRVSLYPWISQLLPSVSSPQNPSLNPAHSLSVHQCLGESVLRSFGVDVETVGIDHQAFRDLCPALLHQSISGVCTNDAGVVKSPIDPITNKQSRCIVLNSCCKLSVLIYLCIFNFLYIFALIATKMNERRYNKIHV